MANKRRSRDSPAAAIKLEHPDRSGPTGKTLLELAQKNDLFKQAEIRQRKLNRQRRKAPKGTEEPGDSDEDEDGKNDEDDDGDDGDDEDEDDEMELSPRAERVLDTLLWCVSLCMMHFTLDVLVQHQYAVAIEWPSVVKRTAIAFPVFCLLFYNLHEHRTDPRLIPGVSLQLQKNLRPAVFFLLSTFTGCYLIHITNRFGYMAVMKRAPPVGCLWVWSVIELDLTLGVLSLAIAAGFMKLKGYGF